MWIREAIIKLIVMVFYGVSTHILVLCRLKRISQYSNSADRKYWTFWGHKPSEIALLVLNFVWDCSFINEKIGYMLFPLDLRANEKKCNSLLPLLREAAREPLAGAVCIDCSWKSWQPRTMRVTAPPCGLPPFEEARIPPQTLKNGAGVERCLEGCRTSGLTPTQRTPQTGHCLKVLSPGSCQEATKDQPRTDHIPEQTLATFQECRADLWGRKTSFHDHWKDSLWLSQLFPLPSRDQRGAHAVPGGHPDAEWASPRPSWGRRSSWLGPAGSVGLGPSQTHWDQWVPHEEAKQLFIDSSEPDGEHIWNIHMSQMATEKGKRQI